ncbi:MAG: hypothetical protein V1659_04910 [Candidatus Woesearchaeota archaeon]
MFGIDNSKKSEEKESFYDDGEPSAKAGKKMAKSKNKKPAEEDDASSFYKAGGDGGEYEEKKSSSELSYYSDNPDSGNEQGVNLNGREKEKPWLFSLAWWEYLVFLIEIAIVVYTFLVIIGIMPLF